MIKPNTRLFLSFSLLLIILTSSSCLNIYEKVHFNRDGSGHVEYTIDMSEMISLMDMFGNSLNEKDGENEEEENPEEAKEDFGEEMRKSMENQMEALKQIEGITKVQLLETEKKGVMSWKYNFSNINALNQAIGSSAGPDLGDMGMGSSLNLGSSGDDVQELFILKGKKLIRKFNEVSDDELKEMEGEDFEMAKTMFKDAKYYFEYSFDGKVKKFIPKPKQELDHSISGKQIKFSVGFLDMMEQKGKTEYHVKFR